VLGCTLPGDPTVSFSQQRVQSRKCQEGLRTMTKAFQKAALACSLATFLAAGFAQEKQQAPEGASLPADDPFPAFPPTPASKAPNSSPDLPKLVVGERWFYRLSPHRMNACNPSGASTFSGVVQSVGDDGITLKRGSREIRLNSSLGELQEVNSTRNVQDTFNFPIVPGKKMGTADARKFANQRSTANGLDVRARTFGKGISARRRIRSIPICLQGAVDQFDLRQFRLRHLHLLVLTRGQELRED